jgi:hypothetical protein
MGPVSGALASPIDSGVEGTCLPRRIESGHTLYLVTAAPSRVHLGPDGWQDVHPRRGRK